MRLDEPEEESTRVRSKSKTCFRLPSRRRTSPAAAALRERRGRGVEAPRRCDRRKGAVACEKPDLGFGHMESGGSPRKSGALPRRGGEKPIGERAAMSWTDAATLRGYRWAGRWQAGPRSWPERRTRASPVDSRPAGAVAVQSGRAARRWGRAGRQIADADAACSLCFEIVDRGYRQALLDVGSNVLTVLVSVLAKDGHAPRRPVRGISAHPVSDFLRG